MVIPTDSASAKQPENYQGYVDERTPRTEAPQGPERMLFAPDLIGTSEQMYAHGVIRRRSRSGAFAVGTHLENCNVTHVAIDVNCG